MCVCVQDESSRREIRLQQMLLQQQQRCCNDGGKTRTTAAGVQGRVRGSAATCFKRRGESPNTFNSCSPQYFIFTSPHTTHLVAFGRQRRPFRLIAIGTCAVQSQCNCSGENFAPHLLLRRHHHPDISFTTLMAHRRSGSRNTEGAGGCTVMLNSSSNGGAAPLLNRASSSLLLVSVSGHYST